MGIQQPLLDAPPKQKASHCKSLYLILTLAAIVSTIAIVSVQLMFKTTPPSTSPIAMSADVDLLQGLLVESTPHLQQTLETAKDAYAKINSPEDRAALADCVALMDVTMDRIHDSRVALKNLRVENTMEDVHTWLSSVLTNHVTCLDGLEGLSARTIMEPRLNDLISRSRAFLAKFVALSPPKENVVDDQLLKIDVFPTWVTRRDRRLMSRDFQKGVEANVVVAKDGSGKYKTVKEAVAAAPDKSTTRYVIYVKKGTYKENIEVGKNKKNLMIVGDGMDSTIITGSLNVVDGSTTFNSATLAAVGDGFIAQDIGFQNTAGAAKHQAVALRVGADQSVINRCRIDAFQDTLYAHSNRQFYRDSYITGTVDFIFGNAAVVFQNCKIVARKPASGQNNMVTAQGRTDPNQNTGTSIQKCEVIASSDLVPVKGTVRSYLGRPWKEYSRTVVMQSTIGDHIDPAGWSIWTGDFALKTLYYGEYANSGPGAGTSKRVTWAGYHVMKTAAEAQSFTVAGLIQGGSWLKSTGVSFTEGL